MGRRNGLYKEDYPKGTKVRVADASVLASFKKNWKVHYALESEQLKYAGVVAAITNVMFYHGGSELYELENVPGIWHEECLDEVS